MGSMIIDGIKMHRKIEDFDGDGIIGENEAVNSKGSDIFVPQDRTETGEALAAMTIDRENDIGTSDVDFISNLSGLHTSSISAGMMLSMEGVYPKSTRVLIRELMRILVSRDGTGRKQNVEIAVGRSEKQNMGSTLNLVAGNRT